nr:unnamed protein product [Spirometra erinaceieuropaei]
MSLTKEALFPAAPFVERAKRVNFGAHPKGRYILYGNKKNNHSDNDVYFNHPTDVRSAKYSPSGFYVASGDKSGKVQIWDATQKEHFMKNEFCLLSEINDLAWSSDSARIAVGGRGSEK